MLCWDNFQSKKRFNDCLCGNGQLREEIDSLRNEHKRFECLYKKLEKEVRDQRGDMGEVIERSTAAYDARHASNHYSCFVIFINVHVVGPLAFTKLIAFFMLINWVDIFDRFNKHRRRN